MHARLIIYQGDTPLDSSLSVCFPPPASCSDWTQNEAPSPAPDFVLNWMAELREGLNCVFFFVVVVVSMLMCGACMCSCLYVWRQVPVEDRGRCPVISLSLSTSLFSFCYEALAVWELTMQTRLTLNSQSCAITLASTLFFEEGFLTGHGPPPLS